MSQYLLMGFSSIHRRRQKLCQSNRDCIKHWESFSLPIRSNPMNVPFKKSGSHPVGNHWGTSTVYQVQLNSLWQVSPPEKQGPRGGLTPHGHELVP